MVAENAALAKITGLLVEHEQDLPLVAALLDAVLKDGNLYAGANRVRKAVDLADILTTVGVTGIPVTDFQWAFAESLLKARRADQRVQKTATTVTPSGPETKALVRALLASKA